MAGTIQGIIDVHAHSMLRSWYGQLEQQFAPNVPQFEGCAIPEWNPETAIEVMDQHGIEAMVLSNPVGTKDMTREVAVPLARRMNEELAGILARYPKRFGAFATLPLQDMDATLVELEYALDTLGFDGVCLQTSFEGAYPGHPRFEAMFAELDRRRSTAFVHPASPGYAKQIDIPVITGVLEYPFDTTRAAMSLVLSGMRRRHPHFNYISTHGGGSLPYLAHRIAFVTARRGTGFETQLSYDEVMAGLKSLHYDLAIATTRAQLLALRELVPPSQILLGFDYPMVAQMAIEPAIKQLLTSEVFTREELNAIANENAFRILPRLAKRLEKHATPPAKDASRRARA